uniref:Ovule protein n=1 Tax=Heterorhabditis bacteriophora TaxID=37862 RepID=A0A1I7WGZ5_HETBA
MKLSHHIIKSLNKDVAQMHIVCPNVATIIPTLSHIQLNPSNIGTRGCKRKDANSTIWINGPT